MTRRGPADTRPAPGRTSRARTEMSAAIRLTRPRQWPILSAQMALGVLIAPGVVAGQPLHWPLLLAAWLAWVVCLNGGTLAFNSAYDRDVEDIAYLRRPPPPPLWLAPAAVGWMVLGGGLGWFLVNPAFGALVAVCLLLSILYSHPRSRWKARPGLDLAVNVLGYGCGTTLAGLLAGEAATAAADIVLSPPAGATVLGANLPAAAWWIIVGFGLLFGSFYPLTQIYQLEDDRRRGDQTLSTALGPRRALGLAALLGLAASVCFFTGLVTGYWPVSGANWALWLLVASLAGWLIHIVWWAVRAPRWRPAQHERGMYRALALWAVIDLTLIGAIYFA